MSITTVEKDLDALTLTLVAEFDAPVERVWRLWADPRRLERWWGPPGYPATVERHDLVPGGEVAYFMTGPDGQRYHGWWRVTAVTAPTSLEFRDGFADESGTPLPDMPVTLIHVTLAAEGGGTRMELVGGFASREEMQQQLDMGMAEGMTQALGQIDALLAE
jgi:uncharacterized protein YndB with AHSA1/START domain